MPFAYFKCALNSGSADGVLRSTVHRIETCHALPEGNLVNRVINKADTDFQLAQCFYSVHAAQMSRGWEGGGGGGSGRTPHLWNAPLA